MTSHIPHTSILNNPTSASENHEAESHATEEPDQGIQRFTEHIKQFPSLPYLFVGSGLSRRYAGLSNWEGLLKQTSELTGRDFRFYRSSSDGKLPAVASMIAEEFHDIWWAEDRFRTSREEYADRLAGRTSPYKVEVSKMITDSSMPLPSDGLHFAELEFLRAAKVDGVITTNYDQLLEEVFPTFYTYIGQDELLFAEPQGVGEIYKIHGCVSRPESLVLTAEDYQRFNERNPYLAAKLLTMFVEHPTVFLGYSFNDENIRRILTSLSEVLTQGNIEQLQDRLIFCRRDTSRSHSSFVTSVQVVGTVPIPIHQLIVPDFIEVFSVLASLDRKFPVRILRHLKESVYDLVLRNDPSNRLGVVDIEEVDSYEDMDIVIGVGIKDNLPEIGYRSYTREDLLHDIVYDDGRFRSELIVEQTLPEVLSKPGFAPIHKYLHAAGYSDPYGYLKSIESLSDRLYSKYCTQISEFQSTKSERDRMFRLFQDVDFDLDRAVAEYGPEKTACMAALSPPEFFDLGKLNVFIRSIENSAVSPDGSSTGLKSRWGKLVCFYDYVKYGPPNAYRHGPVHPEPEP